MNKTFNAFIEKNKSKISDASYDGYYYDVIMQGFCDDGDNGRHMIIDTVVSEVMRRVRAATPCKCPTCVSGKSVLEVRA